MSDNTFGNRDCYICGASLDPLTSTCPDCGYSQTPNPDAQSGASLPEAAPTETSSKDAASELRKSLRTRLDARRSGARDSFKSKLKK